MHGPAVLSWLLALLTTATGVLCLLRLRGRGGHGACSSDAAEAAMGLGTAAMITLSDRLPASLWVALFGLLGAAALAATLGPRADGQRAHQLHHAVGAAAMVYMALAMRAPERHPGMVMSMGLPPLTGLLLLYFGGYALWSGSRLLTADGVAGGGGPAPQACRLAMGIGMFAMLLAL